MPVRWGLLSTALINEAIIAGAAESERAEIVAVASRDSARAETYAREHRIPKSHGTYEALLDDAGVDAVYVSLPNSLHVEWATRALEAGKHVLCEKPFSRRAADVERAFEVAERHGLILSEAFMWRHHPQTRRLADLVAGGAVGRVRTATAVFSQLLAELLGPDDTRFDPALDGGSLMDLGCYCVNGLRLICGEPLRVVGEQAVGPTGVDLSFAGVLTFADDVLGHFDCSFVLPRRTALEVAGEEGVLYVADPWHPGGRGIDLRRGDEVEQITVEPANSYRLELDDVSAAIEGVGKPLLGRDDALGQARAIESLYASAAS